MATGQGNDNGHDYPPLDSEAFLHLYQNIKDDKQAFEMVDSHSDDNWESGFGGFVIRLKDRRKINISQKKSKKARLKSKKAKLAKTDKKIKKHPGVNSPKNKDVPFPDWTANDKEELILSLGATVWMSASSYFFVKAALVNSGLPIFDPEDSTLTATLAAATPVVLGFVSKFAYNKLTSTLKKNRFMDVLQGSSYGLGFLWLVLLVLVTDPAGTGDEEEDLTIIDGEYIAEESGPILDSKLAKNLYVISTLPFELCLGTFAFLSGMNLFEKYSKDYDEDNPEYYELLKEIKELEKDIKDLEVELPDIDSQLLTYEKQKAKYKACCAGNFRLLRQSRYL